MSMALFASLCIHWDRTCCNTAHLVTSVCNIIAALSVFLGACIHKPKQRVVDGQCCGVGKAGAKGGCHVVITLEISKWEDSVF